VKETPTDESQPGEPGEENNAESHYSTDPESFIPLTRRQLVEACLEDGHLPAEDHAVYRRFARILTAWFHHEMHETAESLKARYDPLNPDSDLWIKTGHDDDSKPGGDEIEDLFRSVAERANYREIPLEAIRHALEESSLIDVRTTVDFNDFERIVGFYRGDTYEVRESKRLFRKIEQKVDVLQRVALLLHFKDADYFAAKSGRRKKKAEELPFDPGKIYFYFYKNVPKHDIELLFPNVEISMTLKDRLLFGVPAIGASVGVVLKALPRFLIIAGVILFFTMGPEAAGRLGVNRETVNNFMPILAAVLALVVTLGGFAFKQWDKFKSKKIKFQKTVADTLFFRNLASNVSVIHRLVDQAEEAESKEILLVYYHLLVNGNGGMTKEELDGSIETWMEKKFARVIDFDIDGPVANLQRLRGTGPNGEEIPLLTITDSGHLRVAELADSCRILDQLWDGIFDYSES